MNSIEATGLQRERRERWRMEGRGVGSEGEIEGKQYCLVLLFGRIPELSFRERVSNLGELDCRVELGEQSRDRVKLAKVYERSCWAVLSCVQCSPPGSSVRGIFQARILEWVAFPPPGDLPHTGIKPKSHESPALASGFFTTESPGKT